MAVAVVSYRLVFFMERSMKSEDSDDSDSMTIDDYDRRRKINITPIHVRQPSTSDNHINVYG